MANWAAATGTRRSANLNTLHTTGLEQWWNPGKAEEIIFDATPAWWIFAQNKKVGVYGFDVLVRILESKNLLGGSFQYFDNVNTTNTRLTQGARFPIANYSWPISIAWQQEKENKDPVKLADIVELAVTQAELSAADMLETHLFKGNIARATDILGIEQICDATTDSGTVGGHTNRWQYRQSIEGYGTITRVAWTSDTAGGTGWEPLAVDFDTNSAFRFEYDSLNGQPSTGLQELLDIYTFASQGIIHPNLIMMSQVPFRDYEMAAQTKMQITKESAKFGDIELGFDNLKYKNAIIIRAESAVTQNATGAIADDTNGEQNVYLLNTDYIELLVEEGCDFVLGEPRTPVDQHASTRHMIWSGQLVCVNPRYQARIYAYPTS